MTNIRVIVAEMPEILGEIVTTALDKEKALCIVGKARNDDDLVNLCARTQPDAVVMGSVESNSEATANYLLNKYPYMKIVALASNERTTFLFELRPHKVELGALSPEELGQIVTTLFQPDPVAIGPAV